MLQQMRLLLEHGHAQTTGEWLLTWRWRLKMGLVQSWHLSTMDSGCITCVHAEVGLKVPRHAKLLAAVLASVFSQVGHVSAGRTAPVTVRPTRGGCSSCSAHETVLGAVLALVKARVRWQATQNGASARQWQTVGPGIDKGGWVRQRC